MKPLFVQSIVESVEYLRGTVIKNHPVNLSLCKSVKKSRCSWYPDNEGLPSIKFEGCDTEWVYKTEADRDYDFEKVASNQF